MICAVIDNITGEQVNLIVADANSLPPDGCHLVEIPEGFYWDGSAVSSVAVGGVSSASSSDVNPV